MKNRSIAELENNYRSQLLVEGLLLQALLNLSTCSLEKELQTKWRNLANSLQFLIIQCSEITHWRPHRDFASSAFPIVLHTATVLYSQLSPWIMISPLFSELPCLLNHWQLLFLRGNIKWWGYLQISLKQTAYHFSVTSPCRYFKARCVEYCREPFAYQRRDKEV